MKEIKVTFETITPLWTGDAWGENSKIRPSSLMGSLRFWFEVISYFSGVTTEGDYKDGKIIGEVKGEDLRKQLQKNGTDFSGIDRSLAKLGIPLPARVFGCTGWKGWVRIMVRKVDYDENNFKQYPHGRIIRGKNWFWKSPSYQGKFSVTFEVDENILESIFYPLLNFMNIYGLWGGGWNIGYGRLKIDSIEIIEDSRREEIVNWQNKNFAFSQFFKDENTKYPDVRFSSFTNVNAELTIDSKSFQFLKYFLGSDSFFCNSERELISMTKIVPKQIRIAKFNYQNNKFEEIMKKLLIKKAEIRDCLRPHNSITHKREWNDFRHELLGTTANGSEGTKIIPWITKVNGNTYGGGFISIAGMLRLERSESDNKSK